MIQVCEPVIAEKEIENVMDCLRTGWISSSGKYIEAFETEWAKYCGMKYGVAVCNGSVALSAAVASLDLTPGDEVIVPSFTIISCVNAILESGAVPVLVDCTEDTWTMDVNQVEEKITPRTRAIMPVHIYGHPVNMEPLFDLAQKYNLAIIEDAAEAHGAEYQGRKCGGLGDLSCFSFYANKIITTGEGGMVLTNSAVYAEKLRSLRNLGFRKEKRFYHTERGFNFRMTNLQAAIGLGQLERIETHLEKKRWIAQTYNTALFEIDGLQLPIEKEWAKNVYWMYAIVLKNGSGMDADRLANKLKETGIETRPFFLGMHEQPVFHRMGLFVGEHYPVCENIARMGLYLPSGLNLDEEKIKLVTDNIKEILLVKKLFDG